MNSLPKTVTRQRRDCDLNPGLTAPESSTLTTRLPSHRAVSRSAIISFEIYRVNTHTHTHTHCEPTAIPGHDTRRVELTRVVNEFQVSGPALRGRGERAGE